MSSLVERICPVCHELYKADVNRLKHGRQTTCSRKCSYVFRATKITGAPKKPRIPRIQLKCPVCHNQFERLHSECVNSVQYCSYKCSYKGRRLGISVVKRRKTDKENYEKRRKSSKKAWETRRKNGNDKWSEETKIKKSIEMSNAISSGKIKKVSKLETFVSNILETFGVEFEHQSIIHDEFTGRYSAVIDFLIPSLKIAVEINGTFWHSDPRFYPDGPKHKSQIRTYNSYNRKRKLIEARNLKLVEIWEHDINRDPHLAIYKAFKVALE